MAASYKKTAKKVTLGKFRTHFPKPPKPIKSSVKKPSLKANDPAQFGYYDAGSPPLSGRFDDKF